MNKLILALSLTTLFSPAYADFGWYSSTSSILYRNLSSDDVQNVGGRIYKIRYSSKFERLEESLGVDVEDNGNYLQIDAKGENAGQCVSFVKAVANVNKTTDEWIPVKQVGVDSINVGRVVAVFGSDGKYPEGGYGHTGIYLGEDSEGMWILDQNWTPDTVAIHKIGFRRKPNNGSGRGDGDRNNAYSYFTFK